jgi:hypothetical protein
MNSRIIALSAILFAQPALAIDVQLGDIKDSRTTGQFFNGMEVELKLVGDEMADAKAIRTKVATAIDSTGRELLDPSKIEKDFQALDRFGGMSDNKVTLKLNNPARKAESMKELRGTIELFVPKNDPQATIGLKGFKSISGKPIDAPALKAAGIELTLLTAAQAAGQQKQDTEKKIAEMRAQGMSEEMIQMASSFASGFGGSDENGITIQLKDPNSKLVSIDFLTAAGEKIDSNGSMTSGGTVVKYFNQPIPDDAQVMVYVISPKALVNVPIQLSNITLP